MSEQWLSDPAIDRLLDADLPVHLPAGVRTRLVAALGTIEPVTRMPGTAALVTRFLAAFVLLAAAMSAFLGAPGWRALGSLQAAGMAAVLAAGVILVLLSLAWQMRPGSLERVPAFAVVGAVLLAFLAGAAFLFPWRSMYNFVGQGWPCLAQGVAAAAIAAIGFGLLGSRGVPLSLTAFGGILGGAAGLLGVTVLQVRCIHHNAGHIVGWHGSVLLLTVLSGIAIGGIAHRISLGRE